ncbi:hypothetical protein VB735_24510 [Halotia wernerae UHCC 0503]|nr:hypothetical protein [Halotia wernerae UHCC 0503]
MRQISQTFSETGKYLIIASSDRSELTHEQKDPRLLQEVGDLSLSC